jgi:hypothetical protein
VPVPRGQAFEDVSQKAGLGLTGIGANVKIDSLSVCDVNGDGRPDFLLGAGEGLLALGSKDGTFTPIVSGIPLPSGANPAFADFNGDGHVDIAIAQKGGLRLLRGDGSGRFTDVTAQSGAPGQFRGWATSAAWGDLDNDGHLDLVVGCLRGPNRFFRNRGDGTFEDASESLGLTQRIFNTQAVALVDLNNDGFLDVVFNNEGQDSVVLIGDNATAGKRTPLAVTVAPQPGLIGSRIEVLDQAGKLRGRQLLSGGDGRGGQTAPVARFTLEPGTYRVDVRLSTGQVKTRDVTLKTSPLRTRIE